MLKIFTGDNELALKDAHQAAINAFVSEHGDLAVERFDNEESSVESIIDGVMSMSFLASSKIVVISGGSKELYEKLLDLSIPQTTEVVVLAGKLDKRAGYYKKLQKLPGFKNFELTATHSLPTWVMNEAKLAGASISSNDARHLVEYIGPNQLLLKSEIEKLALYNKKITKAIIEELCDPSPQSTIFQLVDAVFSGNQRRAEQLYHEQRAQKVEPHAIIGMLAWQLHILALVKSAGNSSADEVARQAKLNPFVVRKSQAIARRLTLVQIKQFVKHAHELDISLKSKSINTDDAMTVFLLKLAAK